MPSSATCMKSSASIPPKASQFFAFNASHTCLSLASRSACETPAGVGEAAALAFALALVFAPSFVFVVVAQADAATSSAASAMSLFMAGTPPKVLIERHASYAKSGGESREKDEG